MYEEDDGETLRFETDYFRAFPKPSDVFTDPVDRHSEFLLPLATISLRHLSPDWDENIHVAMPIEPAAGWGCVGERSKEYHNYLCRPNWIGYHLVEGKLQLACNFRYFHKEYFKEHPPKDQHAKNEIDDLGTHYVETRLEFDCRRQYFREHGLLINSTRPYRKGEPIEVDAPWTSENGLSLPLISGLGGRSEKTNWAATHFPLSIIPRPIDPEQAKEDADSINSLIATFKKAGISIAGFGETDEWPVRSEELPIAVPKTEDGRDFSFVGCLEMGTYLGIDDCGMMVFYDHREKTVLTTFDWT